MRIKKKRKKLFKTMAFAMLLSLTACRATDNEEVTNASSQSNITVEEKKTAKPSTTEEPNLPQYELYQASLKEDLGYKLLKQEKSAYTKEYKTEDEIINALKTFLNDWDAAGVASILGRANDEDGNLELIRYCDSMQEEWNKIKGNVTCKKTGTTFKKEKDTIVEYVFTFDMQEVGPLNLKKGKNDKYFYVYIDDYGVKSACNFWDEKDKLTKYDYETMTQYASNYKTNFGLSTSDEWYSNQLKKDNFVLHMENDREYKVDLDGDGKEEALSMNISTETRELGTGEDAFSDLFRINNILINNKKQDYLSLESGEFCENNYSEEGFYLLDIDNTDNYIEIAIKFEPFGAGSYTERQIEFYRYIDGKLTSIGAVPDSKSSYLDKEGIMGINGDGTIEAYADMNTCIHEKGKCTYVYLKTNNIIEQKSKWCYFSNEFKDTFIKDYEAYKLPEDGSDVINIKKGEEITFLASNIKDWLWCENSDGTKFYIKYDEGRFVSNNSEKKEYICYELFENLVMD